jgi:hypothetical protein
MTALPAFRMTPRVTAWMAHKFLALKHLFSGSRLALELALEKVALFN